VERGKTEQQLIISISVLLPNWLIFIATQSRILMWKFFVLEIALDHSKHFVTFKYR